MKKKKKKKKLSGAAVAGAPREHQERAEAIKKAAFLQAMEKALGVVTTACRATGVGRRTFYDWMKKDKEFEEAIDDLKETAIDFVESNLLQAVQSKSPGAVTAQIFFLKCRAKHRGYVEKFEVTGQDGKPMVFEILSNVPRPDYSQPHVAHKTEPIEPPPPPSDPEFKF